MLQHCAIIMDGNGRWAEAKHLPRSAGHKKGAETAKAIIKACPERGIEYLTLYTFSAENWDRPEQEVSDLMNLLRFYLDRELKELHENGVRMRFIGDREQMPSDIRKKMEWAEQLTKDNAGLNLNIALSYGSRQEIINAIKNIIDEGDSQDNLSEELLSRHLYTADIPDPDLLIRTGGETRLSNFLLWQSAYTELYFTDTLWPNFNIEAFDAAIGEFHRRERRFGKTQHKEAV